MSFLASSLAKTNYGNDNKSTHLRPAGAVTSFSDSAKDALSWSERPPTPDEQKKYRQSTIHEPGKIVKHFGLASDPTPEGVFGAKTDQDKTGRNVAGCFQQHPDSEMARWKMERSEDHYASAQKEPLGTSMVRGHNIPDGPYGMTIDAQGKEKAGQARHVIFPSDRAPEDEESTHKLYVASHAAYGPGEQRRRNYNWDATGVDPGSHRFGAVDKDDYREGVKKAIHPGLDQTLEQTPKVASKLYEDHKLAAADRLGQVRQLGTGERGLDPAHTYGVASMRHGPEPGMKELLTGGYSVKEQEPDADLGKSLREGWRNIQPEDRTFGTPSIRTDIAMPKARSVSSTINYGNEPDALQLIRPPRSVAVGVHEEHYIKLRPKAEIQELVAEAAIELSSEEFDKLFAMSAEADGETELCCLDTFFRARHHVLAQTINVPVHF